MGNENRTVHYQSLLSGTDHPLAPVNNLCECCIQRIDKIINSKGGNIKGLIDYPKSREFSGMGHDVQHCIISDDTLIIKEIALTARMFKIEGIEGLSDLNIFELLVKPLPNQIEKTAYGDQAQSIRYNIIEELKTIVGDYSDQMLLAEALKAYIFAGKNLKSPEYYEKYTENCLFVDWDGTLFIDGKFSLENFEFAKMHSEIYDGKLKIWTGGSNLEKIREILIENLGDKANDIEILQKQNFYGIEVAGAMDDNREKEETSRYCFKVQHYINI